MEAAWMMLQQPSPDDYVIATGQQYSLEQFINITFSKLDLDWHDFVVRDPRFYRPAEIPSVVGDYSKAKNQLGWEPRTSLEELIEIMLEHDLSQLKPNHRWSARAPPPHEHR